MAEQPNNLAIIPPPEAIAGLGVPTPPSEQPPTPPIETTPAQPQMKDVLEHAREAGREKRHKAFGKLIDIMDTATGLIFDKDARSEFGHYCGDKLANTRREIGRRTGEIVDKGKAKVEEKVHQADTKAREIGCRAKNEVIIPAAKKTAEISVKTAKVAGTGALFLGAAATFPVWGPAYGAAYVGAKAEQYVRQKGSEFKQYAGEQYEVVKTEVQENARRANVWANEMADHVQIVADNAQLEIDARRHDVIAKVNDVQAIPGEIKAGAYRKISGLHEEDRSLFQVVKDKVARVEGWFAARKLAAETAAGMARWSSEKKYQQADSARNAAAELRAMKLQYNRPKQPVAAPTAVEAAPVEPAAPAPLEQGAFAFPEESAPTTTPPTEVVTPPATNGTA